MDQSMNRGFGLIAGYIFGNNRSKSGTGNEKIAMTSPVNVDAGSEKIAMTTPVTMDSANGRWRVFFVMPARYTLAQLQRRPMHALHCANCLRARQRRCGSPGSRTSKVSALTAQLLAAMRKRNLQAVSAPRLARYDPPWTLPFMRRNELLIDYK